MFDYFAFIGGSEVEEQEAYVDLLYRGRRSADLRSKIAVFHAVDSGPTVVQTHPELLIMESWWYLAFRTCGAAGTRLIASFFKNEWKDQWVRIEFEKLIENFEEFVASGNWMSSTSGDTVVGGLGPWIPPGGTHGGGGDP